ncbi:MAG: DUF4345 domain-containing protein [Bacteroidota bacterium]
MTITLQILLGLVSLICFAGGLNLLLKGPGYFLPAKESASVVLDNLFRFLAGIYFGLSFLMAWIVFHVGEVSDLIYFIGLVVVFSGLGRLYSRIRVGKAGAYFDFIMLFEVLLGTTIMLLFYFRA